MKTVAFVPIRLNSKRVPHKNLKLLGERPLLCYVLETLVKVAEIDAVYVYCSSDEILRYLPEGVLFLKRPEQLDRDETLGAEIYDAFIATIDADVYLLAHTTSPFMKAQTVSNALRQVQCGKYDSAFSVEKIQTFAWYKGTPLNYAPKAIPRTQNIEPVYIETSAFYIFCRDVWQTLGQRVGHKPYMAVVDKIEGVDIDTPDDFKFAEQIVHMRPM